MKIIYRILCGSFAMVFSCAALASSEPPYGDETPNPESKPMAFAQCIEIIRDYEDELGPRTSSSTHRPCALCSSRPIVKESRSLATGMTAS